MPSAGFKLAIPATMWLQTCTLDLTATEIDHRVYYVALICKFRKVI